MREFTYEIGPQGAQDRAKQFMGNDIVRGIVELVTNSDSAYTALGSNQPSARPISIIVNPSERWFEVRDRAGGMSPKIAEEKFTQGGVTSNEGQRGYFGLGAKDCAVFGSLTLKTIDKDDKYTEVSIPGNFVDCYLDSRKATQEHYKVIHGSSRSKAGTLVRIDVDKPAVGGARMPRFDNLLKELRTHYALRALHQRNKVILKIVSKGDTRTEKLSYPGFPWENYSSQIIYEGTIEVGGYSQSQPTLRLFQLSDPVEGNPNLETFEGFVLIRTEDIADYGFTLGGLEGRDHAKRIAGLLNDDHLQTLLRQYRKDGASDRNPRPVVSQDRRPRHGGLDPDHPYTKALFDGLRPILQKALKSIQSEFRGSERSGISQALQKANAEAGRQLSQMLDIGGGPTPRPLPDGFYFLPTSKVLKQSSTSWDSLSLYLIGATDNAENTRIKLQLKDKNTCEIDSAVVNLRARPGNNRGYRASVRLRARSMLGDTTISALMNGKVAKATVSVVENPPPPIQLQFEHSKYTVQPSRRRTVRVLIPESLLDDTNATDINLSLGDSGDGIVVRGPSILTIDDCDFDSGRIAYIASFQIEGRQIGAKARLKATYGSHQTQALLSVGRGTLRVFFDDNEKSPPNQRAKVYNIGEPCSNGSHENELCLHIFARHPRINPYLGEPQEESDGISWNLNDSPGFRAMYADCIAEAMAEFQLTGADIYSSKPPEEIFDSFWSTKKQILTVMHQVYIDDMQWKSQASLSKLTSE